MVARMRWTYANSGNRPTGVTEAYEPVEFASSAYPAGLERLRVWDILWALRAGRAPADQHGAVAQLGERLHGMQEVVGSIPIGSTFKRIRASRVPRGQGGGKLVVWGRP